MTNVQCYRRVSTFLYKIWRMCELRRLSERLLRSNINVYVSIRKYSHIQNKPMNCDRPNDAPSNHIKSAMTAWSGSRFEILPENSLQYFINSFGQRKCCCNEPQCFVDARRCPVNKRIIKMKSDYTNHTYTYSYSLRAQVHYIIFCGVSVSVFDHYPYRPVFK
jgi:hypothetical protein